MQNAPIPQLIIPSFTLCTAHCKNNLKTSLCTPYTLFILVLEAYNVLSSEASLYLHYSSQFICECNTIAMNTKPQDTTPKTRHQTQHTEDKITNPRDQHQTPDSKQQTLEISFQYQIRKGKSQRPTKN